MKQIAILSAFIVCTVLACVHRGARPRCVGNECQTWTYQSDGGFAWYTPVADAGYWTWVTPEPSGRWTFSPSPQATRIGAATPSTWSWVGFSDAAYGSLATSSGYLYDVHCVLTEASGSAAMYVMGFDTSATTQPGNGAAPIAGVVSGGLTTVGNDVSYSDEQYAHGVVNFATGFLLALSTTADTYTAPAAGNQVRCDAKLSARR